MPVINILPQQVADMIAAGEVVERPASVIKELVENSIDAGANNICVEIKNGGATYIRVTDDGCGMAADDAGIAFIRHATSKLSDARGLEAVGTMGFRGEALAAISAVSRVELLTRRREDGEGTRVRLTAGEIDSMESAGCPAGTTMMVRELFFNTPARFKFLKSDKSEAAACTLAALRCALGHPELSLRYIRDGQEELFSPGDGRADSCVYTLLGRDLSSSMLECTGEVDGMALSGFVSSPANGRGSRSAQYFYCNGRFIKSALLQAAVEQAYKNTLLTGKFPACVLYLKLSCAGVDVNVHPAKTEVKFAQEKQVFDLVYYAVLSALKRENNTAPPELQAPERRPVQARTDFYKSMSSQQLREQNYRISQPTTSASEVKTLRSPTVPYQSAPVHNYSDKAAERLENTRLPAPKPPTNVEKPVQNVEKHALCDHKIVGEALKTYIIVESGGELILIDKHAAHERIIFDRLKAQGGQIMSQTLLTPVPVRLDIGDSELLEQNAQTLSSLGFEAEPLGEGQYALRAVPADIDPGEAAAAIEEIMDNLRSANAVDPAAARDEMLHTVACKAAIKAGWVTQERELEALVSAVISGEVKYCPHGRPIAVRFTRRELDKLFKRIV